MDNCKHILLYGLLIICFALNSCNIINPDEDVPGYIRCDSATITTDNNTQGSNSSRITDAWIYVDDIFQGAYELPAHFPLLSLGNHKIKIDPGITINGIAASRAVYPFYSSFDTTINIVSLGEYSINPVLEYNSLADFAQLENFEGSISLTRDASSDTALFTRSDAESFESGYGCFFIDDAHPNFKYASTATYLLPYSATAYLELNYKCNQEFIVGLTTQVSTATYNDDAVIVKASSSWKKIYILLSDVLKLTTNATGHKIFIRAVKSSTVSLGTVYIDNLKVIY